MTPEQADRLIKQRWGNLSYLEQDKDADLWRVYQMASRTSAPQEVGHGTTLGEALAMADVGAPQVQPSQTPAQVLTYADARADDLLERVGELVLVVMLREAASRNLARGNGPSIARDAAETAKAFVAELRKPNESGG